jgi:O-antigen biosynthesis protein
VRVSIVIPCHNAEPYLAQTIGSALDQSVPPDQIVIVDDGSTDGSLAVAQRMAASCGPLVRVYSERSGNASRTRNIGASLATGDAVLFLDADDVLGTNALEALVAALAAAPGGVAACPWQRLVLDGRKWVSRPATCARRKPDQDALGAWMTGWYYPPCAVLWSKDAFVRTGGWDETAVLNQDGDIMMRALVSGIPLVETSSGKAYYRRLPEGQVSVSGQRFSYGGLAGRLAIMEKIACLLEEQGRLERYRADLSEAFALIATDAAGLYGGLSQQAWANSRHYGPSVWSRAVTALARPIHFGATAAKPLAAWQHEQGQEVRSGTDRAERLLSTTPVASPSDRACAGPLPDRPAVSVVITAFNRARLLARALESVIAQTFADFEVLVVDDCSRDDLESVVTGFRDRRLRYLRQPENRGVAAARNRGMRESRAPFVAFLDDDDEWFPDKLAQQIEVFRVAPPDVGLVYTGTETVSDHGTRSLHLPTASGDLYRELLVKNLLTGPTSVMIRRNVIAVVGFFDEELPAIEDFDYWLRVCRRYKVARVGTPLARYNNFRDNSEGAGQRRSLALMANLEARAAFYRKHGAQMRKAGVAHLFLAGSARRHLTPERGHMNSARWLALQALLLDPTSWEARHIVLETWVPTGVRTVIKKGRNFFQRAAGTWSAIQKPRF